MENSTPFVFEVEKRGVLFVVTDTNGPAGKMNTKGEHT